MAEEIQCETHQDLPDQLQSPLINASPTDGDEEPENSYYDPQDDDDPYASWDSYSLLGSAYCCSCCLIGGWYDYQDEQETEHLIRYKRLRGRPMSHLTENPRGKHHRNPLPWSWKGKERAAGWDEDKRKLDLYLWREEQAGRRRPEFGVRNPKKTMTGKKKKAKKMKQRRRTQEKEIEETLISQESRTEPAPKKLKNPHFLLQIGAHARRNRVLDGGRSCSCCYAIAVDYRETWRRKVKTYVVPNECREGTELAADLSVRLPGETVTDRPCAMWGPRWRPMLWDDQYEYYSGDESLDDWEGSIQDHCMEGDEEEEYQEEEEAEERVMVEEEENLKEKEEEQIVSAAEPAENVGDEMKLKDFPALDADDNNNTENVSGENVVHAHADPQPERDPDLGPEWAFIARAANGEKVFEIGVSTSDCSSNCTAADWAWVNDDDLFAW